MIRKYSIVLLVVFSILCSQVFAAEIKADVDYNTGVVMVDYSDEDIAGKLVTIEVIRQEDSFDTVDKTGICYADADLADDNGYVRFNIKHNAGDGRFKIRLSSYKSFSYEEAQYVYEYDKAAEILEIVNTAKTDKNAGMIYNLLTLGFTQKSGKEVTGEEVCELLKVPEEYGREELKVMAKIIAHGAKSENLINVINEIQNNEWLVEIDTAKDTAELTLLLEQYNLSGAASEFFSEILEDYESSEKIMLACLNNINQNIPCNSEELEKELISGIVLKGISTGYGYETAKNIIKKYNAYITDDSGRVLDITKCSAANEPKVYGTIIGKTFSSLSDLKLAFEKALESANKDKPKDKGGPGGGGGGGIATAPILPSGTGTETEPEEEPEPKTNNFKDMTGYEWATEAVDYLYNAQVIHGRTDTEFAPAYNVTRAEFVTMIVLAHKLQGEAEIKFIDVPDDLWCSKSIKAAVANSVVNGIGENEFGTDMNISRQDAATIISRLNPDLPEAEPSFNDNDEIADYAFNHVGKLCAAGVINGTDGNNFCPNSPMTRAEAAVIIYRELKLRR